MKRTRIILALIICASLALSCLAACGKKPAGNEPESTSQTGAAPQVNDFEKSTFGISTALSFGLRFFEDSSYLENSSVLWNTLGWYCAYQQENGGKDYLTRTQTDALQHALLPNHANISAPENWINGGSLIISETDGETRYSFPGFSEDFKTMTDTLNPQLSVIDGNYVKVILTAEDGKKEEYVFGFKKDDAIGGEFPYILSNAELPEVQTAVENEADFTVDELKEANSLSNLLDVYKTVSISCSYAGKEFGVQNFFKKNGEICVAGVNYDEGLPGGASYYGTYGSREFSLAHFEDDPEKTYLTSSEYISLYPDYSDEYYLNERISQYIDFGSIAAVKDNGDTYSFEIYNDYYSTDEFGVQIPVKYVVDKGTLALRSVTWSAGTEDESVNVFTYGGKVDDYGLFDGWDRPLRTVRVVAELHDENGNTVDFSKSYEVPDNMELYPVTYKVTNLYFNKGWTKPYKYSDKLGDYTIYVTDVMG